jgi:hypothetical protein
MFLKIPTTRTEKIPIYRGPPSIYLWFVNGVLIYNPPFINYFIVIGKESLNQTINNGLVLNLGLAFTDKGIFIY